MITLFHAQHSSLRRSTGIVLVLIRLLARTLVTGPVLMFLVWVFAHGMPAPVDALLQLVHDLQTQPASPAFIRQMAWLSGHYRWLMEISLSIAILMAFHQGPETVAEREAE